MTSDPFDIREIYAKYRHIVSRSDHEGLKEPIDMISKSSEPRGLMRINQSKNFSIQEFCNSCGDMETPGITRLNLLPGCKRKPSIESVDQWAATPMSYDNSANPENLEKPKRARQMHHKGNRFPDSDLYVSASEICPVDSPVDSPNDVGRPSPFGCLQSPPSLGCLQTPPSACAVEDCLSKGFEGHLLSMAVFSSTGRADCHTHNFLQVQKSLKYAM